MPQWTLLGLLRGRETAPWPLAEGTDGQEGFLGMPRYQPERCSDECKACADICPTRAITMRSAPDAGGRLDVDYGRCVVCQLCTEACPTGAMSPSSDWAFGVRARDDLIWSESAAAAPVADAETRRAFRRSLHMRHVDAGSCNGCEVRAAGAEQSVLQPAPARHLLHRVAAFRRPSVGDRAGDQRHARSAARHL